MNVIALIPARSGSKRVADKNIKNLGKHPLLAYTIEVARKSKIFNKILLSTDSEKYAEIGKYYGAEVPFLRPVEFSTSTSSDYEWISYTLDNLQKGGEVFDCFSILRPTSPFRKPETITRAWNIFISYKNVDSLRAVELCHQHPGKMWVKNGDYIIPLLPLGKNSQPWHSTQYAALPEVYEQNASLEIGWTRIIREKNNITGDYIVPFFTDKFEGFDINTEDDWYYAEYLILFKNAYLPEINIKPYSL